MKKISWLLIVIMILSITPSYGNEIPYTSANGQAAIVMETETGRVLFEKNSRERMPMASTTKIMTALLAIENVDSEKFVKVAPEAQGIEGSSIYLRANERVKMVDLLYGLMLRSGNDSATAIAIEVAGSVEKFAELMTLRAKELGANDTSFMNPHGLHHDDHYTTAYDLALITKEALKKPLFKKIVSTKFYVAESRDAEFKYFSNKNKILNTVEGGDGVKTGFTKKSGRCLVASATRGDMQLIAITLNDGDWFNTTHKLLDDSFELFMPHTVFEKGEVIGVAKLNEGKRDEVNALVDSKIVLPVREEEKDRIQTVIDMPENMEAPILKGQKLGKVSVYLEDQLLATSDLIAEEGIERLTMKDKLLRFLRIQ
ncbi:D-alanyl-D-alanine carboxypeptidase family protein [Alkaliphilus transvaalensis]|uniref:D-alanyl-D-alanine carboxypeptidase family protein n=1 Tax=Alkaliphilus transvaalensis TaxID=114628 RepID=UPI00047B6D42|nr:D-alanyl-D-alanine carboxypeptidase family protein [Alkaliphilus transvaalensis]